MQKSILVSLVTLSLSLMSVFTTPKITYSSSQQIKNTTPSTVKISVEYITEDKTTLSTVKRGYSATGFSIASSKGVSLILTNQHVCSMREKVLYELITQDGQKFKAVFVRADKFADICLLATNAVIPGLPLAREDATHGDRVITIGAPDGMFPIITDGIISGYYEMNMKNEPDEDGQFEINFRSQVMSTPIYQGSSGSPVLNTYGEVVGIVFAVRGDKEHISFIVPVNEVWRFLDVATNVRTN